MEVRLEYPYGVVLRTGEPVTYRGREIGRVVSCGPYTLQTQHSRSAGTGTMVTIEIDDQEIRQLRVGDEFIDETIVGSGSA